MSGTRSGCSTSRPRRQVLDRGAPSAGVCWISTLPSTKKRNKNETKATTTSTYVCVRAPCPPLLDLRSARPHGSLHLLREGYDLVELDERGGGDGVADVLGADDIEKGPQLCGGEHDGGSVGEGEAAERAEGGDERVLDGCSRGARGRGLGA